MNLAVRLLYSLNKEHKGFEWKEFTIKEDRDGLADYCSNFEVVAFSCYIWNITQTLDVARRIKQKNTATKILLGGPEVSYEWEDVIQKQEVDYIIIGEGEIPFAEFIRYYPDVKKVNGIIYKQQQTAIQNLLPAMFDLNNYRGINPYIFDEPEWLKTKVAYIETSRGCPYKCEFCLASLDNKVRFLPIEDLKKNLLFLMQHGKVIKFLDRTFNVKKDFTIDIFQFILQHHQPGNIFQFEITADIVHPEIIQFIAENVPAGLFRFEIGIQTVNQKANLEVSRKQNFEKTKSVILQLADKIEMHLDLIVGLPLDYWDDIKYSFEEVFKIFPEELQLGFLKFLKGTPVRQKYAQHNFVFDPLPPYQIIESKYLSKMQLQDITLVEETLEIYWNKKRAINTLKYVTANYSIFDFLLGLGKYFNEQSDFHKHSLIDIYEILFAHVTDIYKNDSLLREMVVIDYFLHSKDIRPKNIFSEFFHIEYFNSTERNPNGQPQFSKWISFGIHFNFKIFQSQGLIDPSIETFALCYTGNQPPKHYNNLSKLQQLDRVSSKK